MPSRLSTGVGTHIVRDIAPGNSSPGLERLTVANNIVYFFASDGVNGVELWRSDGTLAGTHIVADIKKGPDSSIPEFPSTGAIASIGGILYFAADDGTAAGTKQLSNIFPGAPHSGVGLLTPTSSGIFFVALDGSGTVKLAFVKTDGSSLHVVSDLSSSSGSNVVDFMAALGADVVIDVGGVGLYHADINSATLIASNIHATAGFQAVGSHALFSVGATYDPSVEVWTTDGTASGTHRLGASLELRSQQAIGYGSVVGDDGFVYFAGLQFTSNIVYSIWRTDGTDAGTSIFTQAPGAPLLLPIFIVRYQGKIFFSYSCDTVSYSGSDCLWASDGTSAEILAQP